MTDAPQKALQISSYIATALLWLVTAGLGLYAVYHIHSLSTLVYAALGGRGFWAGSLIGQAAALVGGIIWLAVIVITGEYYMKHAGEKSAWKIIAWVLAVEILIILVGTITA